MLNFWASKRILAEADPKSGWNKKTAIVCFVENTANNFAGAAVGVQTEVAEVFLRTDAFEMAPGIWTGIAKLNSTCLATTAGVIFVDARIMHTAPGGRLRILESQV